MSRNNRSMIEQPLDVAITAVTTTRPKARESDFMVGIPDGRRERRGHIAGDHVSTFTGGIGRAARAG